MSHYRVEKQSQHSYFVYKDDYMLAKEFRAYREATYWVYGDGGCPACFVTIVNTRCDCLRKEDPTYEPAERAQEKAASREADEGKTPEELAGNSMFKDVKMTVDLESAPGYGIVMMDVDPHPKADTAEISYYSQTNLRPSAEDKALQDFYESREQGDDGVD